MEKIDKTKEELEKRARGLLEGKPLWIWWISYTVFVGVLFSLIYLVWTLLTGIWWAILIIIPVAGITWSTIAYYNQKPKPEKKQPKK